jgi:hypothetical protein
MFLALAVLALAADWAPMRWFSADPSSLDLVRQSPVNCLLLEEQHWQPAFTSAARDSSIATLGVVRPESVLEGLSERAAGAGLTGIAFQGRFEAAALDRARSALRDSGLVVVEIAPRSQMRFTPDSPIAATYQGVWPGINEAEDGEAKAAPSGAPWIDTNAGFLRFVRSLTGGEIWISYGPPKNAVIPLARYLQAIGDAAINGARWIVELDEDFQQRLLARDEKALQRWAAIAQHLRFFEEHKEWRKLQPYSHLALVQDKESGALLTGSILDMIVVKHTPVRPVPSRMLSDERMAGLKLAVNVDPTSLQPGQTEVLRRFTRSGGTLLTAPPGWKFPEPREDQITLDEAEIEKLDSIWKEVNSLTGRRNLGVRLFNVASMLSNLYDLGNGDRLLLQLVNYSDYPIEAVTAHLLGKYSKATLLAPGREPKPLGTYETEEGTGIEIDVVHSVAALIIER